MNAIIQQSRYVARALMIGLFFAQKYRNQAVTGGVPKAARNMRKQGIPVDMAVLILAYR